MFLNEPPPSQGDLHFRLFGFPVRVTPFFWLITVLLELDARSTLPGLLMWIAAVFVAILVHELGHATVMRSFGFHPWITLHGFGGSASYDPAWQPDGAGIRPTGQMLISAAGPGAGFLLAALLAAGLWATGNRVEFGHIVGIPVPGVILRAELPEHFVNNLFFISIFWGVLNLLPIYPLDGGHIAREFLSIYQPREGIRASLILSGVTAMAMALFALLKLNSFVMALFFGYLSYTSLSALRTYTNRNPWE
jgi:stage IV sporulation protein FB